MSAVSMKVTPSSTARRTTAFAAPRSGRVPVDRGMAPSPMREIRRPVRPSGMVGSGLDGVAVTSG